MANDLRLSSGWHIGTRKSEDALWDVRQKGVTYAEAERELATLFQLYGTHNTTVFFAFPVGMERPTVTMPDWAMEIITGGEVKK